MSGEKSTNRDPGARENEHSPLITHHSRLELGARGEDLAANYLKAKGYRIVERNYKCRTGEADLIAAKDSRLIFVEIKTRATRDLGDPEEAVDAKKQLKLVRVAQWYLTEKDTPDVTVSFDIVSILWDGTHPPEIDHIEDALELEDDPDLAPG